MCLIPKPDEWESNVNCKKGWDGESFEGENFREFRGFVAIHESFLCKIGGVAPLVLQNQAICESFLCENYIFTNSQKFFTIRYISKPDEWEADQFNCKCETYRPQTWQIIVKVGTNVCVQEWGSFGAKLSSTMIIKLMQIYTFSIFLMIHTDSN